MIRRFQGEHRFLSNFWPAPVPYEGVVYPSVEHAYQAAKYPPGVRDQFRRGSPGAAKRLAKAMQHRADRRADWADVKYGIMFDLVWEKFRHHPHLKEKLLATGDQPIIEGNTWGDTYWGVDLVTGEGSNHLGNILTQVRRELRR